MSADEVSQRVASYFQMKKRWSDSMSADENEPKGGTSYLQIKRDEEWQYGPSRI